MAEPCPISSTLALRGSQCGDRQSLRVRYQGADSRAPLEVPACSAADGRPSLVGMRSGLVRGSVFVPGEQVTLTGRVSGEPAVAHSPRRVERRVVRRPPSPAARAVCGRLLARPSAHSARAPSSPSPHLTANRSSRPAVAQLPGGKPRS
jgi:hypothetical protein